MAISEDERAELKEAFDYNDSDNNGRIDFVEFIAMLEGLEADIDTPQAQIGFETIDSDGNGTISFDEFLEWWKAT